MKKNKYVHTAYYWHISKPLQYCNVFYLYPLSCEWGMILQSVNQFLHSWLCGSHIAPLPMLQKFMTIRYCQWWYLGQNSDTSENDVIANPVIPPPPPSAPLITCTLHCQNIYRLFFLQKGPSLGAIVPTLGNRASYDSYITCYGNSIPNPFSIVLKALMSASMSALLPTTPRYWLLLATPILRSKLASLTRCFSLISWSVPRWRHCGHGLFPSVAWNWDVFLLFR